MIKSIVAYTLLILSLTALFIASPYLSLIGSLGMSIALVFVRGIQYSEIDVLKIHSGSRRLTAIGQTVVLSCAVVSIVALIG